jgi:hypothetical protein
MVFEYDDGTVKARIVCHPATGRQGIERGNLSSAARAADEADVKAGKLVVDAVRNINRTYRVPLLTVACDIELFQIDGVDTKFDYTLCDTLPDVFLWLWEQKVYEVNPHWQFGQTVDNVEQIQKKVMPPTTGSKASTKPDTKAKV